MHPQKAEPIISSYSQSTTNQQSVLTPTMSDKPENNKEDPIIVKDTDDKMKCRAESMIKHLESSTRLPDKIMRILLSKEAPEAIWWLPKGDSFAIQMEKFQEEILMKYFRGNKFKSLVRNMHRW